MSKGGGTQEQTIGYRYYMGIHMAICHGPVDGIGPIYVGERLAYEDQVLGADESITISKPNLFGGDEKEGGIAGTVDILRGTSSQGQNDYLLSQNDIDTDNLPAFRGIVSAILNKVYVTAINPYPKPWWFTIYSIPGVAWYETKSKIRKVTGGGQEFASANGAHLIREVIINPDWGMGNSTSTIDETSFRDVADTLYDEDLGLSLILAGQDNIDSFIQQILRHINGALYTDRSTGKFKLKLLRDDYSIGALPVFNEDNIKTVDSFQRPAFAEMINEVVVIYKKRGEFENSTIAAQDLASVQAQGGLISQTVQYPGIDHPDTAAQVASRELVQQSTPLAQISLTVNRQGWDINPGDVINIAWGPLGISQLILRVTRVDYGGVLEGRIQIDGIEDIFGLPASSYFVPQDSLFEEPDAVPVEVAESIIREFTYWDLVVLFGIDSIDAADAYLYYLAKKPNVVTPRFELWNALIDLDASYTFNTAGSYTPIAYLTNDITPGEKLTIQFDQLPFGIDFIKTGTYGYIDNEMVVVDLIDTGNSQLRLSRGAIDTVPARHYAGAALWFVENYWAADRTEYATGLTVYNRALVKTSQDLLAIGDAPTVSIVLDARQDKPYPPANVEINGVYFSPGVNGVVTLDWENMNRLTQTAPIIPTFEDGNVAPEAGLTYTVNFFQEREIYYDEGDASRTYTGVSDPTNPDQDWATEVADTTITNYNYSPDVGTSLNMPLSVDGSIGGTLSPETDAQNVTNVTYADNRATFEDGHMDIGDFALSTDFCIVITGKMLQDTSTDYHCILGKFDSSGVEIFALYYSGGTNGRLAVAIGTTTKTVLGASSLKNAVKYDLDQTIAIIKSGTTINYYLDRQLIGTSSGVTISSWTGKSWTLGAGFTGSTTREDYVEGSLKDLLIYDNIVKTPADIWPTERINGYIEARIKSIRGGVDSFQTYSYVIPRIGWGLKYDKSWDGGL